MSYEDKERSQYTSNKNKKRKKRKKKNKVLRFFLLTLFWGLIIVVGLGVGVVYSLFKGAGDLPMEQFDIDNFTTIIYDKDGKEYARLDATENRIYVTLDEMSEYLPKAFVAIEDERFYEHNGFDIKRTGAAIVNFIAHRGNSDFGGSTITQQLIKKVTSDDSRSWQRKVREIVRAIQAEQKMTKDQIIELYMNIIFLGENSYGVETAAHTYFAKSAKELDIAECAMIGGLAQAPSSVNPFSNFEAAKNRQELVLGKMLELGFITQEQYDQAKAEELVICKGEEIANGRSNSYFVDAVVDSVIEDLAAEKGIDKGEAQRMVYSKGYSIYTTIDPKIQNIMETVYKDPSYFKLSNGNYDENLQSAMVIVDYTKGNVVGLVGGAGEKTTLRGLNRATQSYRQPGSTMKPMGVYAPGLEKGVLTAASTYDDALTTFKIGGSSWTPKNADGAYRGMTSVRKAIASSINVVASKAFLDVGAAASRSFLMKLGITSLTTSDVSAGTLALGGLTKGISPIEHAGAYSTFANGGIYIEPKLYTKVVARNGETVLEKISEVRQVMSKQNAYILTDMMRDGVRGGTGTEARLPNMPVAGKTGTTNDSKDRWFAGYTPYYQASVWVGYDIQKAINVSGNPAARIWKAVMSQVHEGLEVKEFVKPSGIVTVAVCADSGLLPTELCSQDRRGSRVKSEMFAQGMAPTKRCDMHVECTVCPDTLKLMNPTCEKLVKPYTAVFIDKGSRGTPNAKPGDYDYMVPTEYCTFHGLGQDEEGNWIMEDENSHEIENINQEFTQSGSRSNTGNNTTNNESTDQTTTPTEKKNDETYNYLDVNGVPNWINSDQKR